MPEDPPNPTPVAATSASVEDYLKAIWQLQRNDRRATTGELSQALGVQMASATGMMKQLHAAGYVDRKPYQGVELTPRGEAVALRVLRRHRLLELFLHRTLGIPWDEIHADAERLEHAVSDRLIERIDRFLGEPVFDPHGAPIPQSDGTIVHLEGITLSECRPGHAGEVLHVPDKDGELLRYLSDLGICIGLRFELVDRAPFGGALTLVAAGRRIEIGLQAAAQVLVSARL